MIKWKVAIIIFFTVVFSLGIAVGADIISASGRKVVVQPPVTRKIIEFSADNLYLADSVIENNRIVKTFNIADVLDIGADAEVKSLSPEIVAVTDNVATFTAYGEMTLEITEKGNVNQKRYTVIDGVNIMSAADFFAVASDYRVISHCTVLQRDIRMKEIGEKQDAFRVKADMYGNGYSIFCADFNENWFSSSFIFSGADCVLRDTRFFGKEIASGEEIVLDDLKEYGSLVNFGCGSMYANKTRVYNCVFEAANRCTTVDGGDVEFNGCLFRYAADTNISMKTVDDRASHLTIENCVLADNVVSGITSWMTEDVPDDCQCTITLKGFVDFYCWRDSVSARIVPISEKYANYYNGYLQQVLARNEARESLLQIDDKYYANCAIAVVCTATNGKNKVEIKGLAERDMKAYVLPVDDVVTLFLTISKIFGYADASRISPTASPDDNPYLYNEMRFGRN